MIICQTVFFVFTEMIVLVTASHLLTPFHSLVFSYREDLTANLQKTETSMKIQVCAFTRQTVKYHVSCCFFLEL